MTVVYKHDGFEHQTTSGTYNGVVGTPGFVTSPVFNGRAALEISPAAAAESVEYTTPGGTRYIAQSFWVRWAAFPGTNRVVAHIFGASAQCFVQFHPSTNQYGVRMNGIDTPGGPTISVDTWDLIDVEIDYRTNPLTIKARVNGGVQFSGSNPIAANDLTSFRLGTANADTHTVYHDDWTSSITPGDYPIGVLEPEPIMRVGAGRRAGN